VPADDIELAEYRTNVADEHTRALEALGVPLVAVATRPYSILDGNANEFIDLRSGGGVFALGHCAPNIVEALTQALGTLDIGDWQLPNIHRTMLARELTKTMLSGEWQWRFFVSGSESNDFAIRTAMMATGRSRLVAFEGGYHGQTGLAASATDQRYLASGHPRMQIEVDRIPRNDIDALVATVTPMTGCVMVEPVQLTDSVRQFDPEFLRALRERCNNTGAVLIFDEIKCGLGRTGHVWAHHAAGVVPDILVAGKALSGGIYPVATCGLQRNSVNESLNQFKPDARSSFGGSHLGMVVARAALTQLTGAENRRAFHATAQSFETKLVSALRADLSQLVNIVRVGAAIDIDVRNESLAYFVAADLLHHEVIVPFPRSSHLLLTPPLTIPNDAQERAAKELRDSVHRGLRALDLRGEKGERELNPR
jgi:acetylornithine/succinyldiaminopimelate/putrescine aminotransferase